MDPRSKGVADGLVIAPGVAPRSAPSREWPVRYSKAGRRDALASEEGQHSGRQDPPRFSNNLIWRFFCTFLTSERPSKILIAAAGPSYKKQIAPGSVRGSKVRWLFENDVARTNCEVARNCRVVHPRKGKLVSLSGGVPILRLGIDEESGLTGIEGFKPFSANGQESVLAS